MKKERRPTYFYPDLGSRFDFWFLRLGGHGLGNSFYTYFHAVALAEKHKGVVITPTWFSFKLIPFLRGEPSKRLYWRMFKPFPSEIGHIPKLWILARTFKNRKHIAIREEIEPEVAEGALNIVACQEFTFKGLHAYRDSIRTRLLGITRDLIPEKHCWGEERFIAVHVRLGDFTATQDPTLLRRGAVNTRIPLSWYVNIVKALQARHPDMPVRVFSDGKISELQPLLALGATLYRSGSDITDLLAMSSASLFVGSNSTYSRWAVFLGNMPSIWLDKDVKDEKPSEPHIPILFIPMNTSVIENLDLPPFPGQFSTRAQ